MDAHDFDVLIDVYQCAQKDGTWSERITARRALKDAYRALEAERDALRAKVKQNDTAYISGWNDAHRAIAAKEPANGQG